MFNVAAHRPALLYFQRAGKPENVGSLGDIEKVAKVFVRNELIPLQDRIREINGWLGQEVIRFKNYSLDTDNG
ncbi:portal protein [Escherichia coli]|uniref:portal protein n=1 Tax=Escherichia coli TaxID=562 RepID=UPI003D1EA1F6